MAAIMERLPDTHARNDALSTMLDTAVRQVEAEERLEDARASAAQILADGITRLATRLDQFEKQRALSAKRAEAERKARDAARVQRYLDELPDPENPDPLTYPPPSDLTIHEPKPPMDIGDDRTSETDDGDLEVKKAVDPERYDAGIGDLPSELKKGAPAPSGTNTDVKPDPLGGEDPKQVQQPISASLW
jgi:hypothetical protein